MNEYEDEIAQADIKKLQEQVEGLHEVCEVLLSCVDNDEECCINEEE
jgi:hypothetical protein